MATQSQTALYRLKTPQSPTERAIGYSADVMSDKPET